MNSRYQPGGDIYAKLESQYGTAGANRVAIADASGAPYAVNDALTAIKYGDRLPDSTAAIFYDQVTTDPLAAPLASANNVLGNSVLSFLKNPWVLILVLVLVWGWLGFPGLGGLKKKFA